MNDILKSGKILVTDMICRICLTPRNETISIFTKFVIDTESHISLNTSQIMSVLELLEYFTHIQMYENFSSMVCKTCVKSAYDAFIFKANIRKSETWLQSNISKIKILTSSEENNVYIKSGNEEDLQTIKDWLESKVSNLETNQKIHKKCDNKIDLQEKLVDLTTNCQDLQESSKSITPQLNKKRVTIVKTKIRKAGAKLQPEVSKLKTKLPEENISRKIQENASVQNRNDSQVCKKSTEVVVNEHLVNKSISISECSFIREENVNKKCEAIQNNTNNRTEFVSECLKDHDYNMIFCEVCDEYFPDKFSYEDHKKVHTDRNHKCNFCTKKFKTLSYLRIHLKSHERNAALDQKKSQCLLDQKKSQYLLDINYPLYMDSKHDKFYMCNLCAVVCKQYRTFTKHMKSTHEKDGINYCCNICTASFSDKPALVSHLHFHTNGLSYFCAHCSQKFNKMMELNNHVKTHTADAPLLTIPYDPKLLKDRKDHTPGDIPFLKEKNEKMYLCPQCGKRYKFRYEFKNHLEFHAGKDKALCPICGKVFRRLQLKSHIERHSNLKPYKCKICDKTYKQQNSLKAHMMSHTGRIPHTCEICGKKFKEKCYLRYHMKYHNNERNHECHICGKKFVRKSALHIHFKTHTQERPYSCKFCNQTFRTSSNRKYHEYGHEGIKPFSCKICQTPFRRPNTLRNHMKVHNKTKTT